MKELNIQQIRKIQLHSLEVIHKYCNDHNLKYFLIFGTLLGSIRHNGYIPWDDDIDVMMPRKDYEYLISHFNEEDIHNKRIQNKYTDKDFIMCFSKLIDTTTIVYEEKAYIPTGVWIDIFPYDNVPDNKIIRRHYLNEIYRKNATYYLYNLKEYSSLALYKRIYIKLLKTIYSKERMYKYFLKLEQYRKKYMNTDTKYSGLLYWSFGRKYKQIAFPTELVEKVELHKFENLNLYIPSRYDEILRGCYDDYMTLPKKEEQHSNHNYKAYLLDDNDR